MEIKEKNRLSREREILNVKAGTAEEILMLCDAMWIYQGTEGEPHALLTSGKHSDGYINLNEALKYPNLCKILAKELIKKIQEQKITNDKIDAVVSSSFSAITLGYEVARQMSKIFVFTEKVGDQQKWGGRFKLPPETRILQVEELITTFGTTRKVKEAVLASNPKVKFVEMNGKSVVATIVYRPEDLSKEDPEFKVIALIQKEIHNWGQDECPLCQKGSVALRPKQNWQRFTEHK